VVEEDDLSRAVDDLVRRGQIVLGEQSPQTLLGVCVGRGGYGRSLRALALRVWRGLRRFSGGSGAV
jgi:hypothetical protein